MGRREGSQDEAKGDAGERSGFAAKPSSIGAAGLALIVGLVVTAAVLARAFLFEGSFESVRLLLPLAPLRAVESTRESDALPASPGSMAGFDVLLVTIDTTRPDRIGLYGNDAIATPVLDALAREGVVFTSAVATTSSTLPTHGSILTGLYPHRHGARANSRYRLDDEITTLAEVLEAAGYMNAAFVSALVLDGRFGLDQGFTHYDAALGDRSVVGGFAERRADDTVEAARRWLEMPHSRPIFTWVHFFDPHGAYSPPAPYAEEAQNPYDGEIAFVDAQIGRLVEMVRARERRDTLIIVTADHGEAMGEHGELSHGYLAQEATLRIPLVIAATSGLTGGVSVATRVSQVDLMPTVLTLLGIAVPDGLDGVALTAAPDPQRPILAEAVYGQAFHGWAPLAALYEGRFKLVDGPHPELYDLHDDPTETRDLAAGMPDRVAAMQARLHALRGDAANTLAPTTVDLSREDVARLESLGYVTGSERDTPVNPRGRTGDTDPKRMQPLLNELLDLLGAYELGQNTSPLQHFLLRLQGLPIIADRDALIAAMEAFAAEHPDFAPAFERLATVYLEAGRADDAAAAKARSEALAH